MNTIVAIIIVLLVIYLIYRLVDKKSIVPTQAKGLVQSISAFFERKDTPTQKKALPPQPPQPPTKEAPLQQTNIKESDEDVQKAVQRGNLKGTGLAGWITPAKIIPDGPPGDTGQEVEIIDEEGNIVDKRREITGYVQPAPTGEVLWEKKDLETGTIIVEEKDKAPIISFGDERPSLSNTGLVPKPIETPDQVGSTPQIFTHGSSGPAPVPPAPTPPVPTPPVPTPPVTPVVPVIPSCKVGSYMNNGNCTKCSKGTYSDTTEATSCTACPNNFTTKATGSTSATDCNTCIKITQITNMKVGDYCDQCTKCWQGTPTTYKHGKPCTGDNCTYIGGNKCGTDGKCWKKGPYLL